MAHKSPHPPALLLKEKGAKLLYFRSSVFKKEFIWLKIAQKPLSSPSP
jgi:hypothetical protein